MHKLGLKKESVSTAPAGTRVQVVDVGIHMYPGYF